MSGAATALTAFAFLDPGSAPSAFSGSSRGASGTGSVIQHVLQVVDERAGLVVGKIERHPPFGASPCA
jgi:hypothetical protein